MLLGNNTMVGQISAKRPLLRPWVEGTVTGCVLARDLVSQALVCHTFGPIHTLG